MIWMLLDMLNNPDAYVVRVEKGELTIVPAEQIRQNGGKVRG